MASSKLRSADREYFALVSEAVFTNPFSARRDALEVALVDAPSAPEAWTPRMLHKLGTRLRALWGEPSFAPHKLSAEERALVQDAVLFEAFHRFLAELDALIAREELSGERALRVDFAASLLQQLVARGLAPERAHRFLELFYQMRRAYHFIARGLVGESAAMRALRAALWQAVFTRDIRGYEQYLWNRMEDFSTILIGETGTGKGAAAAAIGRSGFIPFIERKQCFAHGFSASFLPINLNEFPETLFESEIFGHKKGAFTGAIEHHPGVLARCPAYGTVFFDEIGEATLPVQVKLLRVLQERSFTPVGSQEPQRFGGRILAATHRSLSELRAQGKLRDDFYYRLCSNVIEVPPLRTRIAQAPSELKALVEHLCVRIAGAAGEGLTAQVVACIERDLGAGYAFPGNVRELEQCVRRVLLTGACARDERRAVSKDGELAAELLAGALSVEALTARYTALLYARTGSYVEVARITGLDRRTVKKHVESVVSKPADAE